MFELMDGLQHAAELTCCEVPCLSTVSPKPTVIQVCAACSCPVRSPSSLTSHSCAGVVVGMCCHCRQNEEDDATFWSRLISEPDRPQDELLAPLGPRAARTKQQQQQVSSPPGSRQLSVQDSDELPGGQQQQHQGGSRPKVKRARKPGGGGSRAAGSDKPGAPVEGAVLRIAAWPLEEGQGDKVSEHLGGGGSIPQGTVQVHQQGERGLACKHSA